MSLFGKIASLDEIIQRLPQFQIQIERLEEEEEQLERGKTHGSFRRRCQDLAKQISEQRQKVENAKGGNDSTKAAAILSLDDLQRRLSSMVPEITSTSRSSINSSADQPQEGSSSSTKLPSFQGTRRPSMYDNYSSSDEETADKTNLPVVTEGDESNHESPPTPAPRKTDKETRPLDRRSVQQQSSSIEEEAMVPRLPRSISPGVVEGNKFTVLADLEAAEEGDLSIKKGQLLTIIMTRADGWWKATNQYGEEGLVPKTYLRHAIIEDFNDDNHLQTRDKERRSERQQERRDLEEDRRLERERQELEETRREVEEARRELEVQRRNQQRDLLKEIEEEKERLKEQHIQSLMSQKQTTVETSILPRSTIPRFIYHPLKTPVLCLGDALRADPHLTFECHLTPRLSRSNLSFHDLFWNYEDDKLRKRRVPVSRVFRLVRLEAMPNVEFGIIRAALYDQSRTTGRQIVSNVHTIRAQIKNGIWTFNSRTDMVLAGLDYSDFIVRSNYRMVDVVLLIEASIVEQHQDSFQEKSIGIVKLPIMGTNNESCLINKTYSDFLSEENIFQRTEPRKSNSRIYFKVTAIPNELVPFVDSMPDVLIFNPMYVRMMYFYRRRAGTVLLRDRDNHMSAEMVSDPLLAVFPVIADQPDLMDLLRTMWTSKIKGLRKAKTETEQAMDFFQVFMNTVFCIHKTAIMPDYCIWDKTALNERQKIFMKCVEMLREYKTASRFLLTITSLPMNIYDYSFNILGPHALD